MKVDVVVVGAGPAGSATALRLARAGMRVALVERTGYELPRLGETLPPSVTPLLHDMAVWHEFLALDPLPSYETASCWGSADVGSRSVIASPYGPGWHVDRRRFDEMLAAEAATAGALLLRGAAQLVESGGDRTELTVKNASRHITVDAATVVDASGRAARFATRFGADRFQLDHLTCISAVCRTSDQWSPTDTFLESAPDGWWYVSPLPSGDRMLCFFTDAETAAGRGLHHEEAFVAALAQTTEVKNRATGRLGPLRVITAATQWLDRVSGPRWVAVGDSAFAADPLSSGGVRFALQSAHRAADLLLAEGEERDDLAAEYETFVEDCVADYWAQWRAIYGSEQRFGDASFWLRRHQLSAEAA